MIFIALPLLFLAAPLWAQQRSSDKEWGEILSAAKREGKVVVAGSPDPATRQELPAAFKARFGIPVEWIGGRSSETAGRLRTEHQAGAPSIDVFLSGLQTMSTVLYQEKMIDPLRPALILPEVVDGSKWKAGKLWFMDPEDKYVLRLFNFVFHLFHLNTRYGKPEEFQSIKDLLNPKWKGKISAFDPAFPGPGSSKASRFYVQLGEDFVRRLYAEQQPAFSRDDRQMADWLAHGTHPIALDASDTEIQRLKKEGFSIQTFYGLPDLEPSVVSGFGHVALVSKAPHPNAARIFVNWIASREGLEVYARSQRAPTTRSDIDESFAKSEEIPRPGGKYFDTSGWEFAVITERKVRERMKEILKR